MLYICSIVARVNGPFAGSAVSSRFYFIDPKQQHIFTSQPNWKFSYLWKFQSLTEIGKFTFLRFGIWDLGSFSVSNQQEEQGQDSNSWILGGWTFNCCFSFIIFGPKNKNLELSPSPICVCWLFVPAELGAGRLTNGIDHRNLFLQNSNFAQNAAFQRRDFYTFDLHIYMCELL